jgi:hypothetical protein
MCGRFTQAYTWQEIRDLYDLTGTALNLEPRYNIAPTQQIDVIHVPDDKTLLAKMRWGLIPPWWKKTAKETVGHEAGLLSHELECLIKPRAISLPLAFQVFGLLRTILRTHPMQRAPMFWRYG